MKTINYILGATASVAFLLALPAPQASATSEVKQAAEQAPVMFSAREGAAITRHGKAKVHRTIRLAQGKVDVNKADPKAKKQAIQGGVQNQKKRTSQSPTSAQKKMKGGSRSLLGGDIGIPQVKK